MQQAREAKKATPISKANEKKKNNTLQMEWMDCERAEWDGRPGQEEQHQRMLKTKIEIHTHNIKMIE